MRRALVLGGGGLVGMAYHAGALQALDERGIDPAGADVIVGTSAGAILGSYLRAGWTPYDFFEYAHGRHPNSIAEARARRDGARAIFTPLYRSAPEGARRLLGSGFALAASRGYWRAGVNGGVPLPRLRKLFPSGMFSTEESRTRLTSELPDRWPDRDLIVCAAELYSGRRVAFGTDSAPRTTPAEAVLASTAIPGMFPPVRIAGKQFVDGGVYSATSLDLAVEAGCEEIVCVAPLGFRSDGTPPIDPRKWGPVFVRSMFARALRREVLAARAAGVAVLVVRPWLSELAEHGTNAMRHFDRAALASSAREGTLRQITQQSDHPILKRRTHSTRGA